MKSLDENKYRGWQWYNDFVEIINLQKELGTKWYIVEQEEFECQLESMKVWNTNSII